MQTVTVELPENVYLRLQQVAQATRQSLNDVLLRAVQVGSPPTWEDVPAMFQADLAALDRLDDGALWRIVRSMKPETSEEAERYQLLLHKNANGLLTEAERQELTQRRIEGERFTLRKAHAAALLRWRGHSIPPAAQLAQTP